MKLRLTSPKAQLCCAHPDPSSRGAFRRRLVGGERERHLRAKGDATSVPGRYSGSLVGHYRAGPRSDHRQRHKGQDAALARRKARGAQMHLIVRSNPDIRPEQSGQCALSARQPPRFEGEGKKRKSGEPPRPATEQGPIFVCLNGNISQGCLTIEYVNAGRTAPEFVQMSRAVPQRSLPPCGGGTGRGVQQALRLLSAAQEMLLTFVQSVRKTALRCLLRSHPPPCPSPARGEGTVWHAPS